MQNILHVIFKSLLKGGDIKKKKNDITKVNKKETEKVLWLNH